MVSLGAVGCDFSIEYLGLGFDSFWVLCGFLQVFGLLFYVVLLWATSVVCHCFDVY